MRKAIVIGASSGIGKELAKILSEDEYMVGLVSRRENLLIELQDELPGNSYINNIDVANTTQAMKQLEELIMEMNGVDLIIISAGCGFVNPDLEYEKEQRTIDVNVSGFTAMMNVAYQYFLKKGRGHIVGISSVAAIRGGYDGPAYAASKAFISNYMEGVRIKAKKAGVPLHITDIKAGLVDTAMAKGEGLFWVAPPEKAALQIYRAIESKKEIAYVTKRWRLIAWLLKAMPTFIYQKL